MNYELVKKLKDAGFPQKFKAGDKRYEFIGHPRMGIPYQQAVFTGFTGIETENLRQDTVKIPSLSELIEACGDEFASLIKCKSGIDKWNCYAETLFDDFDIRKCFIGSTPEETVANLWLELNKK